MSFLTKILGIENVEPVNKIISDEDQNEKNVTDKDKNLFAYVDAKMKEWNSPPISEDVLLNVEDRLNKKASIDHQNINSTKSNHVKTHSPLFHIHVVLEANSGFGLPKGHSQRGIYIVKGSVQTWGTVYHQGQMLIFDKSDDPMIVAKEHTTLMLLGGEPLGERHI